MFNIMLPVNENFDLCLKTCLSKLNNSAVIFFKDQFLSEIELFSSSFNKGFTFPHYFHSSTNTRVYLGWCIWFDKRDFLSAWMGYSFYELTMSCIANLYRVRIQSRSWLRFEPYTKFAFISSTPEICNRIRKQKMRV